MNYNALEVQYRGLNKHHVVKLHSFYTMEFTSVSIKNVINSLR